MAGAAHPSTRFFPRAWNRNPRRTERLRSNEAFQQGLPGPDHEIEGFGDDALEGAGPHDGATAAVAAETLDEDERLSRPHDLTEIDRGGLAGKAESAGSAPARLEIAEFAKFVSHLDEVILGNALGGRHFRNGENAVRMKPREKEGAERIIDEPALLHGLNGDSCPRPGGRAEDGNQKKGENSRDHDGIPPRTERATIQFQ